MTEKENTFLKRGKRLPVSYFKKVFFNWMEERSRSHSASSSHRSYNSASFSWIASFSWFNSISRATSV